MSDSPTAKPKTGLGCIFSFGGVFFLVGAAVLSYALWMVQKHIETRDWVAVDATILSADLDVNRDGDGGTTYKVKARYSYYWNGQAYESDRVSFSMGSDNIGDFHQEASRTLSAHRVNGTPATAWVNPDQPDEAVLYRELRWGMLGFTGIFGTVFGGVGLGIILLGGFATRAAKRESERAQLYPNEPWRWRDQWQSSTLVCDNKKAFYAATGFAALWNLVSAPVLFIVPSEVMDKQNYAALIAVVFPLVGLWLIVLAVRSYLKWKRFGHSELQIDSMPLKLGSRFKGTLINRGSLAAGSELQVVLSCISKTKTGSGKNRSTSEKMLWQDEQTLRLASGTGYGGLRQTLQLRLPADGRESSWSDPSNEVLWRVDVQSEIPGADYSASFEIPVIGRIDGREQDGEHIVSSPAEDPGNWRRTGVVHSVTGAGDEFYFPAARHAGAGVMLAVMALLFGGAGIAIVHSGSPIFGSLFAGLGFLALCSAIHTLTHRSVIVVSSGSIRFRRGWLALGRERTFDRSDYRDLHIDSSLSAGNRRYYDITLETQSGQRIKLANSLAGNRDTEQLVREISRKAGFDRK